jgi:hypothetical protein
MASTVASFRTTLVNIIVSAEAMEKEEKNSSRKFDCPPCCPCPCFWTKSV